MGNTIVFLLALCCCTAIPLAYGFIDISGCHRGSLQVTEGRSVWVDIFVHPRFLSEQSVLRCTITRRQDLPSLETVCESQRAFSPGTCNSSDAENVQADWDGYPSTLTISRADRSMWNISCNVTVAEQNYTGVGSCQLDVFYPAEVDSCQFHVNKQLWSVVGSCDVTKVYSSAEVYRSRIYQDCPYIYRATDVLVNHTSQLTSYTNSSSGLMYYGGEFPFTAPLYSATGNCTISVRLYPGSIEKVLIPQLYVEPPSDPILTNCDQVVIMEGENSTVTPCMCRVTSLGSPTGRLRWLADGTVLASGVYGVRELPFPYEKADRTRLGQAMSCQVDWIVSKISSSFTPEFIYGPDTATIFVSGNDGDKANVKLLCTSLDVQPQSALVLTWGGLCEGQTGRLCSLTLPVSEPSETEVTCSVTNRMLPQNRVTAKWNRKMDEEKLSFPEGVGLGAGVMLFVVLVVVAVLLVVLWRRGHLSACQCCVPTYDKTSKRKRRTEEQEHTYTDMTVYEPVEAEAASTRPGTSSDQGRPGTTSDQGRPGQKAASSIDEVYVNVAADL